MEIILEKSKSDTPLSIPLSVIYNAMSVAQKEDKEDVFAVLLDIPDVNPAYMNSKFLIESIVRAQEKTFKRLLDYLRVDPTANNNEAIKTAYRSWKLADPGNHYTPVWKFMYETLKNDTGVKKSLGRFGMAKLQLETAFKL